MAIIKKTDLEFMRMSVQLYQPEIIKNQKWCMSKINRGGQIVAKALTEARSKEAKIIRKKSMKEGKDFSPRRGKELKLRNDDNANTVTANQGVEQLIVISHYGHTDKEAVVSADVPTLKAQSHGHEPMVIVNKARGFNKGSEKEECGTISANSFEHDNHVNNIRRLTEVECERLQGFKDDWTKFGIFKATKGEIKRHPQKITIIDGVAHIKRKISKTQRYKMCGNAVNVDTAQLVTDKLFQLF